MSKLDTWLDEKCQLKRDGVPLRVEKMISNASRYSKEPTLADHKRGIDFSKGYEEGFEAMVVDFAEKWIDEVERSEQEDAEGEYRKGENMKVANEIAQVRQFLNGLGSEITLAKFPFDAIPEAARPFMLRALQKELGSAIRKVKGWQRYTSALIYSDEELKSVLQEEFGA